MSALTELQSRWRSVPPREQRLLLLALGVVALALLWWVALAPALKVLKTAPRQHLALDAQNQQMQRLQAQAFNPIRFTSTPSTSANRAGRH